LPPTPAYELWLTGEGTKAPDRRCPIPSHYMGQCGFRPPFRGVCAKPQGRPSTVLLTAWVPDGPEVNLSDVRVNMAIMRVPVVELLC
jgi:hypothetical protein